MRVSAVVSITLTAAVAVWLTACGGPTLPAPTISPVASATASGLGWDINETPRNQLRGGEFTAPISYSIVTWNPASIDGNDEELWFVQSPITPTYYDYRGDGEPVLNTDYLLSASTSTGPQLVVTLNLNPKAVWNDGAPITAADWVATWRALNGSNPEFLVASTDGWDQISSVEAGSSQHQVVLTFKGTYPDWTAIVSGGPMRAEGVADPTVFNQGWSGYVDAYFSGPYRVERWDQTSGDLVMQPNQRWWGATPLLTKLTWKRVKAEAAAAAFANQEIDYYDIGADADGYAQARAAQNSTVRVAAGPGYRQITFNSKSPRLSDPLVRQAVVMGIDRQLIADSDLAGLPGDKEPLNNNLYLVGQPGYQDQAVTTGIEYDPEGAAAKLESAGWLLNPSTGFREKDGVELSLNFAQLSGVAASENEALQTQKMLAAIGIDLKIVDVAQDWPEVLTRHDFDLIAFAWSGSAYPLLNIGQVYGGTGTGSDFVPSGSNFAQLEIPEVQRLKQLIDVETDPVKRAELGNEASLAIWEAVHTLPLYQRPTLVAVRSNLANIGAPGMARVPKWENVGYTS